MTRVEFTHKLNNLIAGMILEGEHPIIDFVKRSDEEQMRLFIKGLSKCDGVRNISQHQRGLAVDIYFVEDGQLVDPKMGWEYWHINWEEKGGKPILDWDKVH
ncbi:MAG: hypothetical protein LUP94_02685, partial [Candidatus Methanomethylicus sp.]|nr:hypothetical protein [Candidatus Methanomethylicus sp.]